MAKPIRSKKFMLKIEAVSAEDILQIANEVFDENKLSSLLFLPE